MNIVLFGIKGCGKTTFGKKVAVELKCAFIDTDELIEKEYQLMQKKTLSCRDIYQEVGPVKFRMIEYEVVQSLQNVQHSVIAAGGGTMLSIENAEALSQYGTIVYLIEDKETLRKRIFSETALPAFLDPQDPEVSFERMYEERDHLYRRLGAIELNINTMSEEEIVAELVKIAQTEQKQENQDGK
ncbi:MAG: shikimate kinase [Chlamydiota bacterium]